ncbi:MAG: hypothetical protein D3917_10465 [Candidatus Electrothrix sp. AX5]|nr:hypothetical protein [Candidatus Electrothrix sp. AX5]
MKEFYLPYNFIPVTGKIINESDTQEKEQRPRAKYDYDSGCERQEAAKHGLAHSAKAQARHDLWQAGRRSGTFTCQLRIVSPTVVGNEHTGEHPTVVHQYTWNGQPALPANSLRGMISSLAETLSQSALRVLDSKFHPAFAAIDPDLVPWNEERERNSGLTPAELLFGVVENNKKSDEDDQRNRKTEEHTRNLASRVRFYDAVLADGEVPDKVLDPLVVLRELSSPKPIGYQGDGEEKFKTDRPSLYFRRSLADPGITYDDLREYLEEKNSPHPLPHGRKFYLLREQLKQLDRAEYEEKIKKGWKSLDVENKMQCKPIKPGTHFSFQVAFDNLSDAELTLLKTALMPAAKTGSKFYHRLGLGKPLGLGIVQIAIATIEYVDRKQRYSVDGLLKGGGETGAEGPEEDLSLIDEVSLIMIRKAGSVEALKPGIPVHWREGHRDDQKKAAPLPQLNPAGTFLPDFYTLRNPGAGSPGHDGTKQEGGNYIVGAGEAETSAIQWLKEAVSALNNGKPFEGLPPDKIEQGIVGPALSKLWDKITDKVLKTEVKELILSAAKQRKWEGYWKSGGSRRAKKKYDTWS